MAAVQEYCSGEETMKLLTMPDYFPSVMDWQKRREILLDICGDVSDADVIASTRSWQGFPSSLKCPAARPASIRWTSTEKSLPPRKPT